MTCPSTPSGNSLRSSRSRPGYVFLISVLFLGAIAAATTTTLVLLGIGASKSGDALARSEQALWNAQTCVERALRSLRENASYGGDETLTLTRGTCTLSAIGGSGNEDRFICASGTHRSTTRRIEVHVAALTPSALIDSWQEVSSFTLCSA